MKVIYKTCYFRLKPTRAQQELLEKHFGCMRFVYNHFLNQRKEQYGSTGRSDGYNQQAKSLTDLKKQEDTVWLNEINSQSLQFALRCLDTAYLKFYSGKSGFPRFKSKRGKNSFTVPQNITLSEGKLSVPKFKEGIRCIVHRKMEGDIRRVTFSRTSTGKYNVSILTQQLYQPRPKTGGQVGVDLGINHLIVTSDAEYFKNNRYTRKYERSLARAQKDLSRKQKGSHSYEKQRRKVARIHEKIRNARRDWLHQISRRLVNQNDVIVIEDLGIVYMMANSKLAKHIADGSWGTFVEFLEYKADWDDKQVIKIDRFYPSSKTCNKCGWINKDLRLSTREWRCPNGHHLQRDENAAINILKKGLRMASSGTGDYTDGDDVRSGNTQLSEKSEAYSSAMPWVG